MGVTLKVESTKIQHPRGFKGGMRVCPCHHFSRAYSFRLCAVLRHGRSAGANPARQLSLQPVAIGAVVEVTKRLKPSM